MAMKIRYNVHTTNKYSVFDSDNSEEENENKNLKEPTKNENNNMFEKINDNNDEIKKSNEIKSNNSPVNKEYNVKKLTNPHTDRYKYPIPSLNDVNENSYRNYRDNFLSRGNIRNKFPRKRGGGYNNASTNVIGSNNFYRGSRNYDYKINNDRRNYNSYNYNKFDFREKVFNEYNENNCKYDNPKRENLLDLKNKNYDENVKTTRKHESVTIDYDMYRRQQEKKLNSNKSVEIIDKKKKKNEVDNEKSNKINNNTKRNDIDEENKDHPKRKAINVYQYILEEGGRVDRIPGFRRNFRNFRKGDDNNWNSKNDKTKAAIDEKIFKKRDPPNINDTRAFPSLTSK